MKIVVNTTLGVAVGISFSCYGAQQPVDQPNVVFILADDLGYGDLSVYNPQGKIHTPVLDSLAAAGIQFTNAHSSAAVSTPTRYGLMTGRYPWRSRLKQGVLWTWADPLLEEELTLPKMMKQSGYTTALIGKWHLGIAFSTVDGEAVDKATNGSNVDYTKPISDGPTHHGFDYYYGDDVPNFPPYVFIENDCFTEVPTREFPDEGMPGVPGVMSWSWKAEDLLPIQTQKSIEYIQMHKDKPFFLMVSLTAPHTPIAPNAEFEGKSGAGRYGDFVYEMDCRIGEILSVLRREGLDENTIIIFSSDNGSSFQDGGSDNGERYAGRFGSILELGHNPSGNFRGMKSDVWEGGHRVPFIISMPTYRNDVRVSDDLICDLDIFATLAEVVGYKLPSTEAVDSRSLMPLLKGNIPLRQDLVIQSGNGVLSYINKRWKFIAGSGCGGSLNPFAERGVPPSYDSLCGEWLNVQLYDMQTDNAEKNNLANVNPHLIEQMMSKMAKIVVPIQGDKLWQNVEWIGVINK